MDDKESKIIDHVVEIPSFSRNELLSSSLKIMQKDGHSMAFVMTDGKLSGFLFPNDAFSQVIG
jgi:osmoprotectant transport system ATP-binding protein